MKKIKLIFGVIMIVTFFVFIILVYQLRPDKESENSVIEEPEQLYKAICSEGNDEISNDYVLHDILFYDDLAKCTKIYRNKPANNISDYIIKRNDNSIKKIEGVNPYNLKVSSDGEHIGYTSGKMGDLNIVFDNKSQNYDWGYKLTLSPNGKNLGYIAWKDDRYYLVVERKDSYRYEKNSMINKLEFSPDSKSVAFDGNDGYIVYDGREEKQYSGGIWPVFSPDGEYFLHANGDSIMLNGKEVYKGDKVISPQISSDKKHIAYININKNNKWQVFSDGTGQKEYDEIYMLEFSPESKHLTYVGKIKEYEVGKDAYFLVLDGKEIEKYYSNIKYNPVHKIIFSPGEDHIAYTVRYNSGVDCPWNYYVVLDGQKENKEVDYNILKNCLIKNCDSCEYHQDLVFSSDGKYFAFVSSEKDSYSIIKMDEFQDMNDIFKNVGIDNKNINIDLKTKGRIYNFEFSVDSKFIIFNIIFESGEVYYVKELIEENQSIE